MKNIELSWVNTKHVILFRGFLVIYFLVVASCKTDKTPYDKPIVDAFTCQVITGSGCVVTKPDGEFKAYKALSPLEIDGCNTDETWTTVDWYDMNYLWMGEPVGPADYQGRFKLAWDSTYLYILVEVIDDYLNPTLINGIDNYWKGDYVEVFIDEDQSGGNHKYNHQAFAYHVSTEGHAIDKNSRQETVLFDDHILVERSNEGNRYFWEMAIKLFDGQFDENTTDNNPVTIFNNKQIGFSIAYGDNDGANTRENFMGSKENHGFNNDDGYINADVFGSLLFVE